MTGLAKWGLATASALEHHGCPPFQGHVRECPLDVTKSHRLKPRHKTSRMICVQFFLVVLSDGLASTHPKFSNFLTNLSENTLSHIEQQHFKAPVSRHPPRLSLSHANPYHVHPNDATKGMGSQQPVQKHTTAKVTDAADAFMAANPSLPRGVGTSQLTQPELAYMYFKGDQSPLFFDEDLDIWHAYDKKWKPMKSVQADVSTSVVPERISTHRAPRGRSRCG